MISNCRGRGGERVAVVECIDGLGRRKLDGVGDHGLRLAE